MTNKLFSVFIFLIDITLGIKTNINKNQNSITSLLFKDKKGRFILFKIPTFSVLRCLAVSSLVPIRTHTHTHSESGGVSKHEDVSLTKLVNYEF